jgi:hypothetical protein
MCSIISGNNSGVSERDCVKDFRVFKVIFWGDDKVLIIGEKLVE